ncbi:RDD family protein [Algibacter sp.]|nr:RDD family protein [Algibacter sp.]
MYASVFDRFKAAFIDTVILIIMMYIISQVFDGFETIPNFVKIIAYIVLFILYDPLLTSMNGGTVGHSLLKIGVRKDGDLNNNISFPFAIIRFILKAFLGWISLLTISGNDKKKAIHDGVAKSVVVKLEKQ